MKKISRAPAWLSLSFDRTRFVSKPTHTEIINRIFQETASGIGAYVLARRLNSEGVPSIGPSPKWIPSSISKILRNRAVLGEYQAKSVQSGKRTDVGEPVPGYYPRMISDELFDRVQIILSSNLRRNRGRKGTAFTNLFSGLLYCGKCGSRMRFENGSQRSIVCLASRPTNRNQHSERWNYSVFEAAVIRLIHVPELHDLWPSLTKLFTLYSETESNAEIYKTRSLFNQSIKMIVARIEIEGPSIADDTNIWSISTIHASREFAIAAISGTTILTFRAS